MAPCLVLVVDDEPLVRMMAADSLLDAGFEVIEAQDACGALDVLRTTPAVELLCTDVQMPGGLDGVDLVLLARARFPHVRAIIVSGLTQMAEVADVPFLPKPFRGRDLVELAQAELGRMDGRHGRVAQG